MTYTLVLGDSITAQSKTALLDLRPDWSVDGVSGRTVSELPTLIDSWKTTHGAPSRIVVALGTNGSCPSDGWTPESYAVVRQKLPNASIVFVTPYRDPVKYAAGTPYNSCETSAYDNTGAYADWMRATAAAQAGIMAADWRAYVDASADRYRVDQSDPNKQRMMWMKSPLRDGVHPTGPAEVGLPGFEGITESVNGRTAWAKLIARTATYVGDGI